MIIKSLTLIIASIFLLSCGSTSKKGTASSSGGESADLTWEQAKERKSRVSNVRYRLSLKVGLSETSFEGVNTITFDLSDNTKPLRLDFHEGQLRSLKVNGQQAELSAKKRFTIELPAALLKSGANEVSVSYVADYSRQGTGLHRFQDPETKEVFLYTDFEPYDANRMFPAFDQPDLRAVMELSVEAPESWTVVANTMESAVEKMENGRKRWLFPATPPLATYLFAMHAGPYKVFTSEYEGLPLRIFARPSMAKYVQHKDWFTYTRQGLKFFNSYFGMKYPFKKYDQLFVPEFNSGAMENVAAVTFNERLLSRSALTRDQRRNSAGIVLHEMAHMWFGNIVTMAWWNDLWLNESFATFMANLAMHESTEFKESWQDFFADMKDWAYWEDGLVTTHPIEAPVMNVKDAFANFDGITYGKGASVLKQLRYYIGDKAFQEGIQLYMQNHAYRNTELKDFIAALQAKTNKDLNAWADVWLRQSGTDAIAANWACTGDRLKEIALNVKPSPGARFRPQSLDVGLYKMEARGLKRIASVRVDLTKPVESLKGDWACPSFVYPNDNDYGFIASELDWRSLMFLKKQLFTVKDDLLRTIIWNDLWEMVRVGKMPLKEYIEIVDEQLPKENDLIVRAKIVSSIQSAIVYWPEESTTSLEARKAFVERIEKTFLARFKNSKPGSDDQKFWFDNFVSFARSPEAMKQLRSWSTAKSAALGLPLDLDRQWNIAYQLSRFQDAEAKAKVDELAKMDTSDRGVRGKLSSEVVQPLPEVKREWIEKMTQAKPPFSLAESRSVLSSLFPSEQKSLAKPYDERFYAFVSENAKVENEMYLRTFVRALAPVSCDPARSERLRAYLKKQALSPSVAKSLKVSLQEDERCQMVRAKSNL